jgi:hypothetical protein
MKEMIVDYRKRRAEHIPIHIDGAGVEQVRLRVQVPWSTSPTNYRGPNTPRQS